MKNILFIFSILGLFDSFLSAQKITPNEKNGLYGFKEGKSLVVDYQYDSIREAYNHGYFVKKRGNWGLISQEGKEVIPCQYQVLGQMNKYFHGILNGQHGILDSTGVVMLEFVYDDIDHLDKDLTALVKYHGQWCEYRNGIYNYEEEHFIFQTPEVMPRFSGCENLDGSDQEKQHCAEEKMFKFIVQNISYPPEALKHHIQGIVIIRFIVMPDGELEDLVVLRGIGGGCSVEAMSVVNRMPRWTPGMQDGKKVSTQFVMPIKFVLKGF